MAEIDRVKPNSDSAPSHPSVLESAFIFASGTLLSRILGLVRDVIVARYFSVDVRDAFVNAFRLPNVFRRIFGEGALSASFIPVFLEVLSSRETTGDEKDIRQKKTHCGRIYDFAFGCLHSLDLRDDFHGRHSPVSSCRQCVHERAG